jgi:ABC-type transport system substrate-binding protein
MWPSVGFQPAIIAGTVAQDGLALMGIRSTVTEKQFSDILDALIDGTFWVAIFTQGLPTFNPTKVLYDEFHSSGQDNMQFGVRFSNAAVDTVLDNMANSKTLDDVKRYAKEAAVLLAYEQPIIVCYNDVITDAWRTDKFEFPLTFAGAGRVNGDNHYSVTKAYQKNESFGGILKISNGDPIDKTNPWMQQSQYEANINNKIFETLWDLDPNILDPIPRLAYDWDIDPWVEGVITDGAKYTFYLYNNAKWHDGKPVTAHDVNFTLYEVIPQTLGEFSERADIQKTEIPDNHTFILYVNKSSYFQFIDITSSIGYIVPEHIWKPNAGGNYSTFELNTGTWIGSGPYKFKSRVPGQEIKLVRNEQWHFAIDWEGGWPPTIPTYTPPTTTPSTTPPTSPTTEPTAPTSSTTTSTIQITSPSWEFLVIMASVVTAYLFKKGHRKKFH